MKKIALTIVLAAAFAMQAHRSEAAWSAFRSMGTTLVSRDISCATAAAGKVVCAARTAQSEIAVNVLNGAIWLGWTPILGVVATSSPSCADDGAGKVLCTVRDAAGGFTGVLYTGAGFLSPFTATASLFSGPSCAGLAANRIICLARNSTGGLVSRVFNGATTAWLGPQAIATPAYSTPGCAPDRAGGAICMFLSNANAGIVLRHNGTSWSAQLNLGGQASDDPTCSEFGAAGKVICTARGTNNALFANLFSGGVFNQLNWSGWASIGGLIASKASCGALSPNNVVCAVQGTVDGALYTNRYNGTAWGGWFRNGGAIYGPPSCTSLTAGVALCAAIGVNHRAVSTTGP